MALALLGVASLLCVASEEVRVAETGDTFYRFLIWNLALAWMPLALAVAAFAAFRAAPIASVILGVAWLLFFPNAPYMLTDFIHVGEHSQTAPLWYDALMISSFAWTSLLLGLASLYLIQTLARQRLGGARAWLGVVFVLFLASFGVYLGRFVRFNSWDVLVHPTRVAHVIATKLENPIRHPRTLGVLMLLVAFLGVAYGILYVCAGISRELGMSRPGATSASYRRSAKASRE
jgi:uncharacterized membrane protein